MHWFGLASVPLDDTSRRDVMANMTFQLECTKNQRLTLQHTNIAQIKRSCSPTLPRAPLEVIV